jgi:predicted TPR repeat methyltransferase
MESQSCQHFIIRAKTDLSSNSITNLGVNCVVTVATNGEEPFEVEYFNSQEEISKELASFQSSVALLNSFSVTKLPCIVNQGSNNYDLASLDSSGGNEQSLLRSGIDAFEGLEVDSALQFFNQLLQLNSNHKEALFNLACIYHFCGYPILALQPLQKLILENENEDRTAHSLLWAIATSSSQQTAPPSALVRQVYETLQLRGDIDAATKLAVLTGKGNFASKTNEAYVRSIFDDMASVFEEKLTIHLQYDAPWILEKLIAQHLQEQFVDQTLSSSSSSSSSPTAWRMLDLGCGSGLCGKVFSKYLPAKDSSSTSSTSSASLVTDGSLSIYDASQISLSLMIGIDISSKMVDITRALGLYVSLDCCDLLQALHMFQQGIDDLLSSSSTIISNPQLLDLVIAADTFVYVGELGEIFYRINHILKENGYFAFSTEDLEASPMRFIASESATATSTTDSTTMTTQLESPPSEEVKPYELPNAVPGWGGQLLTSARFGHSNQYIQHLADMYHFTIVGHERKTLRTEGSMPLLGNMFVLQKKSK